MEAALYAVADMALPAPVIDRALRDARGVLADMTAHRPSLVRLAARVVAQHSPDAAEVREAAEIAALVQA